MFVSKHEHCFILTQRSVPNLRAHIEFGLIKKTHDNYMFCINDIDIVQVLIAFGFNGKVNSGVVATL